MNEKMLEQRVEELEQKVKELQARTAKASRVRPAGWPKLDANYEPYAGRFAGE